MGEQELKVVPKEPLLISVISGSTNRGEPAVFLEGQNVSSLPIRGYVITVDFLHPQTGNLIRSVSAAEICVAIAEPVHLLPGESWHSPAKAVPRIGSGELASFQARIDLVVFEDGSKWGPAESQRSNDLLRWLKGVTLVPAAHSPF